MDPESPRARVKPRALELDVFGRGGLWFQGDLGGWASGGQTSIKQPEEFCPAWLLDQSDLPRMRLHDLRHTHASIAVKAGVPIGVVSERLGHSDPGFTLSRYLHIMPGMQREAADKIARAVHLDDVTAV